LVVGCWLLVVGCWLLVVDKIVEILFLSSSEYYVFALLP